MSPIDRQMVKNSPVFHSFILSYNVVSSQLWLREYGMQFAYHN